MVKLMSEDNFQKNYSMSTVHKAIQLMRAFTRDEKKLSLTELHKKTGIGKSSLQRLLSTLVHERFLMKDEETKQYSLGMELFFMGSLVEKNDAFLSAAVPVMKNLSQLTKENVSISVIEQNERRCIYNIPSQHELSALTYIGKTSPLYAGASAKTLLAFQSDEFIGNYLEQVEFKPITDITVNSPEALMKDITEIRQQGYAISHGERIKGAMSVCVPIHNRFMEVTAVLTVTLPSVRADEFDIPNLTQDLLNAAAAIEENINS
ncbi:IclR family transcriptional regulator [Planococcus salinus]|uniref:IclR family transcriptional regulator n=1 Tax=Planococcus salinus TaxID=1848460 RepID=A0A3M8P917_9BACL|nr:IclR family transcriptional regulator [Planococcus salinus]RNF40189.1 IclR family transcriptional regulator [Planococcus salinus]